MLLASVLFINGCGGLGENTGLTKVSGIVHVDGNPAEGVTLTFHPLSNTAAVSMGTTNGDGTFQISTYEFGDGVLPGEYAVTCIMGTFDPFSRSTKGDRLLGKYASSNDTSIRLKVTNVGHHDVGTIQLEKPRPLKD